MNKSKTTKKLLFNLVMLLILSVMFKAAIAIPVPHGIDGTIYDLDGITNAGSGVGFSVYDSNTLEFVQGLTNSDGRYSVSLNGNDADTMIINVWNKYHNNTKTVSLQGVMHNVDILLNMTLPPLPPNISSVAPTISTEDELYEYNVSAYDANYDLLSYYLIDFPNGMIIDNETGEITWLPTNDDVGSHLVTVLVDDLIFTVNQSFFIFVNNVNDYPEIVSGAVVSAIEDSLYQYNVVAVDVDSDELYYYLTDMPNGMIIDNKSGQITWTPNNDDVGDHNITFRVSDGMLNASQSFILNVVNTNDEFIINSSPITSVRPKEEYIYDVDAYDIDGDNLEYELILFPDGMTIESETGLILWIPKNKHKGYHNVVVQVSDGIIYLNQSFIVNVYADKVNDDKKDKKKKDEILISNTFTIFKKGQPLLIFEKKILVSELDSVIETLIVRGKFNDDLKLETKEFSTKPKKIKTLNKRVYKYFEIKNKDEYSVIINATIQFRIKKELIDSDTDNLEDVVLNRYIDNSWVELPTKHIKNDNIFVYYESFIHGFSYFAVSLKYIKEPNRIIKTGPKESYIISGTIFRKSQKSEVESGIEIIIINKDNGQEISLRTGVGDRSGAYYTVISGRIGDEISIEVQNGLNFAKTTIYLDGDMKNVDFILKNNKLSPLSSFIVTDIPIINDKNAFIFYIIFTLFISILVMLNIHRKKRKK